MYMNKYRNDRRPLAEGTTLTPNLKIVKLLSDVGGSSLTYLAECTDSKVKVVVKEVYPLFSEIPFRRANDYSIVCDSTEKQKTEIALKSISDRLKQELENAELLYKSGDSNSIHHFSYYDITSDLVNSFDGTVAKYIAIETKDGKTLDDLIRGEDITLADALLYTKKILTALSDTHNKGFLHLDIKPDNLFFPSQLKKEESFCVFLDYGSAMKIDGDFDFNNLSLSLAFASKELRLLNDFSSGIIADKYAVEQAKGLLGKGSDCYSVGCILYRMILGQSFEYEVWEEIFDEDDFAQKTELISASILQRIDKKDLHITQDIAKIISKALFFSEYKDEIELNRYNNCDDFIADINDVIETLREVGVKSSIINKKAFEVFSNQLDNFNLRKEMNKNWFSPVKKT